MSVTHEIVDSEYLGSSITVRGGMDGRLLADVAGVGVKDATNELVCRFAEIVSPVSPPRGWPDSQGELTERLVEHAWHRARGAILLNRLSELDGQRIELPRDHRFAERSDDHLHRVVLGAFKREMERDPWQGGRLDFDDIGVARMEDVDPKRVEYLLARLQGAGLIKPFAMGHEAGHRFYMVTPEGLNMADKLADDTKAPGVLVEETVAEVERALSKHAPHLADRLPTTSLKVAEAHAMTHIEVGEIAQSCDLLLQDFLDLPALWGGIRADKPPKDRTRDRLSILLKARVESETEQDFLPAYDNLFVWLKEWDGFVNKHRHTTGPEHSERRHAKRLVLHTYLLVGDLIDLLRL
jgi:hypothetical protein